MTIRLAINGFGRIGRNFLRAWFEQQARAVAGNRTAPVPAIEIVAINDLFDAPTLAHLLKHDSTHGRFPFPVEATTEGISINGQSIRMLHIESPADCPWQELGVDLVLESTGIFRSYSQASMHLQAGAGRVVVAAVPFDHADAVVVYGVNHESLKGDERIISHASCTTHCLAPVLDVLQKNFGLDHALMTEIHAYTSDQHVLDHGHRDLRRARSAAQNIIPTTSSSISAIQQVLPWLEGRVDGYSIRVPVPNVACVDLTVSLKQPAATTAVNQAMARASANEYRGILGYNTEPLVSSDFYHHSESAVFDATQTRSAGAMVKLLAWYDNEWGYVSRLLDLLGYLAAR